MASIERHKSGVYRIHFRYGAKQVLRSLFTENEKDALAVKAIVEETIGLLRRGRLTLPADSTYDDAVTFILSGGKQTHKPSLTVSKTFAEVAKAYETETPVGAKAATTIRTEKIHIAHLLRLLHGTTSIRNIGPTELQAYINKRAKEQGAKEESNVQPTTIHKELQTFNQVWEFARVRSWVNGDNPKQQVMLPKAAEKPPFMTWQQIEDAIKQGGSEELWDNLFLNEAEVAELLNHIKQNAEFPFVHPMIAFAALTGARRSEILRSEQTDFKFDNGIVTVREKKRKHKASISFRQVQLHPLLATIMKDWFAVHPGGRYTICIEPDKPLTVDEAHRHFHSPLTGKWEHIKGFHTLRHSFASICAMKGITQAIINSWMGHLTEEMVNRYRHLFPEQQVQAMDNLFSTPAKTTRKKKN
jgi:integrase